jgi:predicted double-glycine peptidase
MLINPATYPTFALAAIFFWIGLIVARKATPSIRHILLLLAAVLALPCAVCDLFYTHLFDGWTLFYRFRAAPFSELSLAGIGLSAGMLYCWMEPDTLGEKLVVPVGLLIVLGLPFSKSALAPVDRSRLQQTCNGEVCLQSTMSTCGPSSAATILKLYGRAASEKELAEEAFTYRGGTESWYLARALRRRGFDADFIIQRSSSESIPAPSIAGVTLGGGTGHFVAVLSSTPERVVIGDPLTGKFEISRSDLKSRYHFTGFFLVIHPRAT